MDPIVKFNFDEETVRDFTRGLCSHLAISLSQKLGLDLEQSIREVLVFDDGIQRQNYGLHFVVIAPPDYISRFNLPSDQTYYLDILGIWTESSLCKYWENDFVKCDQPCCAFRRENPCRCQVGSPDMTLIESGQAELEKYQDSDLYDHMLTVQTIVDLNPADQSSADQTMIGQS